jgi:hypothetical protein
MGNIIKILKILLVLLFLYIPSCYAISFETSSSVYDKVLKSLNEEPENWLLTTNELIYIKPGFMIEAKEDMYPEVEPYCTVRISFELLKRDPYVTIRKPISKSIEGEYKKKFIRKIEELLYERLKEKYKSKPSKVLQPKSQPEKTKGFDDL